MHLRYSEIFRSTEMALLEAMNRRHLISLMRKSGLVLSGGQPTPKTPQAIDKPLGGQFHFLNVMSPIHSLSGV
jgi:hypothetical protein